VILADSRHVLGRSGEAAAEAFLRRRGMCILERRYRRRVGEIDLIAEHADVVVFVEVKTRSGSLYGSPAESVTLHRQRRLARAALVFLAGRGWLDRATRFDVVEVLVDGRGRLRINHIEEAFRPS
jgi:putative endonuclease